MMHKGEIPMDEKERVLEALQRLITVREEAQRKRAKRVSVKDEDEARVFEWTLTQLHLVTAIKEQGMANNTFLSGRLNVSMPAITKAVKKLLDHDVIQKTQRAGNRKEIYYKLTESGEELAMIHERLHEQARNRYFRILGRFNDHELETITAFLKDVTDEMENNGARRGEKDERERNPK